MTNSEDNSVGELMIRSDRSGNVRTVFVFTDVPKHYEFRAGDLPLLREGTKVIFDLLIKSPSEPRKERRIDGEYVAVRCILRYGNSRPGLAGLTQYVEWSPSRP